MWAFLSIINSIEGHFNMKDFLDFSNIFLLILVGLEALVAVSYFLYAAGNTHRCRASSRRRRPCLWCSSFPEWPRKIQVRSGKECWQGQSTAWPHPSAMSKALRYSVEGMPLRSMRNLARTKSMHVTKISISWLISPSLTSLKNVRSMRSRILASMFLAAVLCACGTSHDGEPNGNGPEPEPLSGVFSGDLGEMTFNGDGSTVAVSLTGAASALCPEGTMEFAFTYGARGLCRYDVADRMVLSKDGQTYLFRVQKAACPCSFTSLKGGIFPIYEISGCIFGLCICDGIIGTALICGF